MLKTMHVLTLGLFLMAAALPVAAKDDSGKQLYAKKCAMCHGKDGVAKAMADGSSNLNEKEWQKANPPEAIAKVISEGRGRMKGYEGRLSDAEIKLIAEYVKTLD